MTRRRSKRELERAIADLDGRSAVREISLAEFLSADDVERVGEDRRQG